MIKHVNCDAPIYIQLNYFNTFHTGLNEIQLNQFTVMEDTT